MSKMRLVVVCAVVCCALSGGSRVTNVVDGPGRRSIRDADLTSRIRSQPLRFEAAGHSRDAAPGAVVRARGYALRLGAGGETTVDVDEGTSRDADALRFRLLGASSLSYPTYEDRLPGVSNYFLGNDPSAWRTGVEAYARVRYSAVYPGIDLVFYGRQSDLEYDFVVEPGADPSQIALHVEGADAVSLDAAGDIVVSAGGHELRHKQPVIYQQREGGSRAPIDGRWTLEGTTARFDVGEYDASQPLVIDPVLTYATYLGAEHWDHAAGIDVDREQNIYVLGASRSRFFPLANALQPSNTSVGGTLVVSKFTPDGSALLFSSYLGGDGNERAGSIEVDADGNAYILAETWTETQAGDRWSFPSVPGSYGAACAGQFQCVVASVVVKLNASGSQLLYTAFLNHAYSSQARDGYESGLAIDASGRAFVAARAPAGFAMPLVNAAQPVAGGSNDVFVFKLNAAGTDLEFSTWLGGNNDENAAGLDLDAAGNAYVVGYTRSTNFPLTNPLQSSRAGTQDAFLTIYSPTGQVRRSTYLGGNGSDTPQDLDVGPDGSLAMVGLTSSSDFPLRNALQSTLSGTFGYFVMRLDGPDLALGFSSYLGAVDLEVYYRAAVAMDTSKNAYVVTTALSDGLPVAMPFQAQRRGGADLHIAKISEAGVLLHGTYLGGSDSERVVDLDIDDDRTIFLVADAESTDLPVVNPFQAQNAGGPPGQFRLDLYLARIPTAALLTAVAPSAIPPGSAPRINLTGVNFAGVMHVFIGGQPATTVVVNNAGSMDVTAPALPEGLYDLTIITAHGEQTVRRNAVLYGSCQVEAAPATQTLLGSGGRRQVTVATNGPFCGWTAQSSQAWLTLDKVAGTGGSILTVAVAPNDTRLTRIGTIGIADRVITVQQRQSSSIDFDGDATPDLLWQHQSTGDLAAWLMNGTSLRRGLALSPSPVADTNWKVVGAGDLDGDGHADLVWQNIADGRLSVWLMTEMTLREEVALGPGSVADAGWRIRSVGDADADGKVDLFWQHVGDGRVALWLMDGAHVRSGDLIAPAVPDLNWQIVGGGDFTRDGRRDLVWQHADGRLAVWVMDGGRVVSGEPLEPSSVADADWRVRGVGDLNGDGHADLLWQHRTTGQVATWIMNGLRRTSGTLLSPPQIDDTGWHIVGPR